MSDELKRTNWQTTGSRFIVFIDILGFKDFVMRNSHSKVYDLLANLSELRSIIEDANEDPDEHFFDAEIYTVSFSDSIMLFSKTDSGPCFDLITYATRFLFAGAIEKNIPMKGAIAHGELSINKSKQIYFGQPLIDAYQLEEELNYYGIAAHHSINGYLATRKNKIETIDLYFDAKTPMKSGNIMHTNLNWFTALRNRSEEKQEQNYRVLFNDKISYFRTTASGYPRKYIDNTVIVYDSIVNTLK